METKELVKVDLNNENHCGNVLNLLNAYMKDEMGIGKSMPKKLGPKIILGLKKHAAYLGFFICVENEYVALANCNLNYSTWRGKFLINIHDFIVLPSFRQQGIAMFLMEEIKNYAKEKDYCKINLEVRNDNHKAQNLYKKVGFADCEPSMFFWEKLVY